MPCKENDPIKSVGWVTINFTYVEAELDELVKRFSQSLGRKKMGFRPFRKKATWLKDECGKLFDASPYQEAGRDRAQIDAVVEWCCEAAKKRNTVVHRPILSNRKGGIQQKGESGEVLQLDVRALDDLKQELNELLEAVMNLNLPLKRLERAQRSGP